MSLIVYLSLYASVFLTSVLSGVLGMAGGMILMAILLAAISVPATMVLHGAVQGVANGSRAWFLRAHIAWHILPPYLLGAVLALALFALASIQPSAGLVLVVLGSSPWLALQSRRLGALNIEHAPTAVACGLIVSSAQLFAGVSGPLLDVFYQNSGLGRHAVVASKALTQSVGHALKLMYWGWLITAAEWPATELLVLAPLVAIAGTRVGTQLLDRVDQNHFQRVSRLVILAIGSLCLARGLSLLLLPA